MWSRNPYSVPEGLEDQNYFHKNNKTLYTFSLPFSHKCMVKSESTCCDNIGEVYACIFFLDPSILITTMVNIDR